MPNPGVVNNPGGSNGTETAYGTVKRMEQMTRESPVPNNPALNAPKRAQRKSQSPPVASPVVVPQPAQITPGMTVAQTWAEIAADPDASPLVKQYAAAAGGAGPEIWNPVKPVVGAAKAVAHVAVDAAHAVDRALGTNGYPGTDPRSNPAYYDRWVAAGSPQPPPSILMLNKMIAAKNKRKRK